MHDVVTQALLADLAQRGLHPRAELGVLPPFGSLEVLPQLQVIGRDSVLEQQRIDGVPHRLAEVERMPSLVLVDAHDAVAEVTVLAEHVRVRVCSSLCECFHCSAVDALSHSQVVE
jgi:hypothetical protein